MGVYIKNVDMPTDCGHCDFFKNYKGECYCYITDHPITFIGEIADDCPLIEIPIPHGRLIDANKLEAMMYHEAFEIDSDMQKWDSGCWIRYKVFENCMNRLLPDTIIGPEE